MSIANFAVTRRVTVAMLATAIIVLGIHPHAGLARIAVVLISHRLTDVFAVCDRVVALRQGLVIADEQTSQTSINAAVSHIVGAD